MEASLARKIRLHGYIMGTTKNSSNCYLYTRLESDKGSAYLAKRNAQKQQTHKLFFEIHTKLLFPSHASLIRGPSCGSTIHIK